MAIDMCLYVKSGPHVATRDIPVLKIISRENRSEIFGYAYHPKNRHVCAFSFGKVAHFVQTKNGKAFTHENVKLVESGFHSFAFIDISHVVKDGDCLEIHQKNGGMHYFNIRRHKPVLFIIPKGTTLYSGRLGDTSSDQLIAKSLRRLSMSQIESYVKKEAGKSV